MGEIFYLTKFYVNDVSVKLIINKNKREVFIKLLDRILPLRRRVNPYTRFRSDTKVPVNG